MQNVLEMYRPDAATRSSYSSIVFSPGVQEKLSRYLWQSSTSQVVDKRFIPIGKAQHGLTDAFLKRADYLLAATSIPIFSRRLSDEFLKVARDEIEFIDCKIISETGCEHQFNIAKIIKFLPLVDLSETENSEKMGPLAPIIFGRHSHNFFIARDENKRTIFVVSERFKNFCEKDKRNVKFTPVETSVDAWLEKQSATAKRYLTGL